MKHFEILLFLGGASAFLAPRSETKAQYIMPKGAELVPDEYAVKLRDNHTLKDHFENIGLNISEVAEMFRSWDLINSYRCRINPKIMHDVIRHDPGVEHVEHNHYAHFAGAHGYGEVTEMEIPEAPRKHSKRWEKWVWTNGLWPLAQITAGYRLNTPIPEPHDVDYLAYAGSGVNVYVLDTGIRSTHTGFISSFNRKSNVINFNGLKDSDMSPYCNETMEDTNGHGTHVAGIIGRWGYGVAPAVRLVSVKIWAEGKNDPSTSGQNIADAILDITAEHKANLIFHFGLWRGSVINMSGVVVDSKAVRDAVAAAYAAGIPIAAAAGNDHERIDLDRNDATSSYKLPCVLPGVMCVGASDANYKFWAESNFGKGVGVIAPGVDILSSTSGSDVELRKANGTSMATPHVAGVLATIVGFENINKDSDKVYSRMKANILTGILDAVPQNPADIRTPNNFLQTGVDSKNSDPNHPYAGIPKDEVKRSASPIAARVNRISPPDEGTNDNPYGPGYNSTMSSVITLPTSVAAPGGFVEIAADINFDDDIKNGEGPVTVWVGGSTTMSTRPSGSTLARPTGGITVI